MDRHKIIVASASYLLIHLLSKQEKPKKRPRKRRWWISSIFRSRELYSRTNLLGDLRADNLHFKTFCRMSPLDFDTILYLVGPKIARKDTRFRKSIPNAERLAITLRYLASGDSFTSLSFLLKVSKQSISTIVPEVSAALVEGLKDYVKLPQTKEEWLKIADEYERKWNFPHCLGAMEGRHCAVQCPINTGSDYFSYKSFFSIVLFALVDADYCFLYAEVGCQGRISDGGVFRNTTLFQKMENDTANFPSECTLPGRVMKVPYVIVADDAFPLNTHIMKPYSGQHTKGSTKRIFNYRLRARRIVENAFGLVSSVFRVLRKPMLLEPSKAQIIVMACVHLHNHLRKSTTSRQIYSPQAVFDNEENGHSVPGSWRDEGTSSTSFLPLTNIPRRSTQAAHNVRDELAEYFMTEEGKLSWQDNYQ